MLYCPFQPQLRMGTIENLSQVGKNSFLAFEVQALLHTLQFYVRVDVPEIPKKSILTNMIHTFNGSPANLRSKGTNKHKTSTQPK